MISNFFIDLLIDPETGESLTYDPDANTLYAKVLGHRYSFIDTVPRIIPEQEEVEKESDLHRKHGTSFEYRDHYQKDAEIFDYSSKNDPGVTKNESNRLQESIIEEISDDMEVILDVGCGNGWVSKRLVPKGKRVISVDISTVNPLKAVKEVNHQNHLGLIADAFALPIKEKSLDCIIASEILEHVPSPGVFIEKMIRVLKDNGIIIITTPYNEIIEYSLCVHCNKPTPRFAHLHSYNEHNIGQFIPVDGVEWSCNRIVNKYLVKLRSHVVLKFLPYKCWKIIDSIFNRLFGKPTRLKVIIKKN